MDRVLATRATLLTLFLVNFLNFFDRVIPAVVLEPIRSEFGLDDTMLGALATAFTLVYAVAGVPIGRLTDRYRRTRLMSGGVFIWSVLTAASGMVTSYGSLFLIRLGVGVGEATCAPVANSMIGDLFPAEKRSRALGVFMLGLPLGTLAAFIIGGWVANHYGWRAPFFVAAVPGILIALVILRLPEPVRGAQETYSVDTSTAPSHPFRRVMSIKTLWWLTLSGAAFNFAAYSLNTFLPSLIIRYHHASVAQAGLVGALVFGVTGLIGLTLGAQLADRLHRVSSNGRLVFGAVSLLVAAPLVWLGLNQAPGQILSLALLLSSGWILWFMYFVTVLPSVHDVVEPRLRGTAMSIFFFFQYVLGAGFGSLATGLLSDHFALSAAKLAGQSEISDAMRAEGLQNALVAVVPLSLLLTGAAILIASRFFARDVENVASRAGDALPSTKVPASKGKSRSAAPISSLPTDRQ